jgi:hypothetical protein
MHDPKVLTHHLDTLTRRNDLISHQSHPLILIGLECFCEFSRISFDSFIFYKSYYNSLYIPSLPKTLPAYIPCQLITFLFLLTDSSIQKLLLNCDHFA